MSHTPIVYDVNVLINATGGEPSDFLTWPTLPPTTRNSDADCIGVVNDNHDFSLWLSPHILDNTRRVLVDKIGLPPEDADRYIHVLEEIATTSGGQVVDPKRVAHVNHDHEDNLILDLAAHCGAMLIISNDKDLVDMPMWRGTPVVRAHDFAARVDAKRRMEHTKPSAPSTTDRLREKEGRRAARQAADSAQEHIDFSLPKHNPAAHARLQEQFEERYSALVDIVGSWNPHNEKTKAQIDRWSQNLLVIDKQAKSIEELSRDRPEIAQKLLSDLNEKLDTALDRLNPRRMQAATRHAANRDYTYELSHESDDQVEYDRQPGD